MKTRNGFVSNSSSSSFVIFKKALTKKQLDKILHIEHWIEKFIIKDDLKGGKKNVKERFSYYDSDPWRIIEFDDYIFGETSMDNFDINDYFDFIKVDNNFIKWDDGYNSEPYDDQIQFIRKMKKKYRKMKIDKINKSNESDDSNKPTEL